MGWRDWIDPNCSNSSASSCSGSVDSANNCSNSSDCSSSKDEKRDAEKGIFSGSQSFATATHATPATHRQLLTRCREACADLALDPERLASWLIDQNDPDWLRPAQIHWWARHVDRNGFPEGEKS